MSNRSPEEIKEFALCIIDSDEELVVSPAEWLTIPGNTIESFVDGLFINRIIDKDEWEPDEAALLRHYLIDVATERAAEGME